MVGVTSINRKLGPRYNILFSFFVYNFASFTCCVSSGEVYQIILTIQLTDKETYDCETRRKLCKLCQDTLAKKGNVLVTKFFLKYI